MHWLETFAKKRGIHYGIFIFISCCFLASSGAALAGGLTAVYIMPVSKAMGLTPAQYGLWTSATGLTMCFAFPFWGQLIRKNVRAVVTVGVSFEIVGILLFSVSNQVWQLIVIGVLVGVGVPTTIFLTIPTLITNWFAPKCQGKFLGIAMGGAGIGLFIWSPLFSFIVENFGHVVSFRINAALMAFMILPSALFVLRFTPEEIGLKPYGYRPEDANSVDVYEASGGVSEAKAFRTIVFYLLLVCIGLTAFGMGFNNAQRGMAEEVLLGTNLSSNVAVLSSWMISTAAIGNITGKLIYGALNGLIGIKKTTIIFVIMFLCSFTVWLLFPGKIIAMFIGSYLLGTHNGIATVGLPLIARKVFGGARYEKIWSRLSVASAICGGLGTAIVQNLAALLNSYLTVMYFGIALASCIGVFTISAMSFIGKVKWDVKRTKI
jgi:MFS family permease